MMIVAGHDITTTYIYKTGYLSRLVLIALFVCISISYKSQFLWDYDLDWQKIHTIVFPFTRKFI